jgi:hypothetical protein
MQSVTECDAVAMNRSQMHKIGNEQPSKQPLKTAPKLVINRRIGTPTETKSGGCCDHDLQSGIGGFLSETATRNATRSVQKAAQILGFRTLHRYTQSRFLISQIPFCIHFI